MQKRVRNDEAVSPVIGVILMVAITVILAAVIAAFVFGMAGTTTKGKSVAATATQTGANAGTVTYQGGADASQLAYLNITAPNGTQSWQNPYVGQTFNITALTSGNDHVTATARFNDGSEQVILDTNV